MAHMHDTHGHRDVEVIEERGIGAGLMISMAVLLAVAVLAVVLLVAQPWDDGDSGVTPNVPDVTDDSGGGGGGTDGGTDGGTGGGGTDGGSGGGAEQPAQ